MPERMRAVPATGKAMKDARRRRESDVDMVVILSGEW
jgi:hypothetical protein